MSENLSSEWPTIRVNPASKERLRVILNDADDDGSLVQVFNSLLSETLDLIETASDTPNLPPTVRRLREALGKSAGDTFLQSILKRLESLESKASPGDEKRRRKSK